MARRKHIGVVRILQTDVVDGIWIILVCGQEQLSGYMCLNRVETADSLCVVQAFSPCLFQQDDLTGPDLFLKFWQGKLTEPQHYEKWKKDLDQKKSNRITWPQDMRLFCRGCSDAAGVPKRVCLKNFPRKSKKDLFATPASSNAELRAVLAKCGSYPRHLVY